MPDTDSSAKEASPPTEPLPIDGGLRAWSTVAGCFLAYFATFGFVTAFGVFQAWYEVLLPDHSASISWIGAIQLWCLTGLSIASALLNGHAGPHATLAIGTLFTVVGVMTASVSTQYYQFLLSHGLCTGIGVGLTFLPIVGLPNQWFKRRRGLAVGMTLGGASFGGIIWPIVLNQMLNHDKIGYPWTMRTVGFVQLMTMLLAMALIRNNVPRNKSIRISSFPFASALRSPGVDLFTVALFLHYLGVYVPYFYATVYTQVLGASAHTAFYITAVLNAATLCGRLMMGTISDNIGAANTLALCTTVSGLLAFSWQGVSSVPGMFIWTIFYGWFSGASVSLQSTASIPLIPAGRLELIGPYIAIACQLSSFGSLAGNPIAAALLQRASGSADEPQRSDFDSMMWFTGSVLFGAVAFYQAARYTYAPNALAKV